MRMSLLSALLFAIPAVAQLPAFDVTKGTGSINAALPAGATISVVEVASYEGVANGSPITGSHQIRKGVNWTAAGGTITFTGYTGVNATDIAAPTTWTQIKQTGVNYMVTVFVAGRFDKVIYTNKLGN